MFKQTQRSQDFLTRIGSASIRPSRRGDQPDYPEPPLNEERKVKLQRLMALVADRRKQRERLRNMTLSHKRNFKTPPNRDERYYVAFEEADKLLHAAAAETVAALRGLPQETHFAMLFIAAVFAGKQQTHVRRALNDTAAVLGISKKNGNNA